ncbi:UDP-galactopyranose mutase [Planktomarina temperata]|nr:UDP-galactopyranose mutase [Planktomarina temperata]
MKKIAIVGGGLSGATVAQKLIQSLNHVDITIFEKNSVMGGNLREKLVDGTLIHKHGPHIFHTKSDAVWKFIKPFSDWEPYFHRVTAFVRGQNVPIPFNFRSMDLTYGSMSSEIKELIVANYGFGARLSILKLLEAQQPILQNLGREIFNEVFKGYSEKQWGTPVEQVAKSVLSRVPVVCSYDERYFDDKYQFIPRKGYNCLIQNMLDDDRISVQKEAEINIDSPELTQFEHIFCTGAIDDFFKLKFGKLNYRSLLFQEIEATADFPSFPTHQTNFPNEFEFTRVTKYGLISSQTNRDVFIAEIPKKSEPGDHKYYPVSNPETELVFKKYAEEAKRNEQISFCGRLADFKYYNMDQVIARAIKVSTDYVQDIIS